jgi:hypothetical protein
MIGHPVLDPKPSGKAHDFSWRKIQTLAVIRPDSWKNPMAKLTAPRDQDKRGTCVGQSTAYCYDIRYMMLTKDLPTDLDKSRYKKDVLDPIGTRHDELYPTSASAEMFYQMSRYLGNVTYPEGSETRFAAKSWIKNGMNLETHWHTDKEGTCVWMYPPGVRQQANGGMTPEQAAKWALQHTAEGWAMVGDEFGNATFDEVCDAIYQKGFVLGAIPVFDNYTSMQGGDGHFPEPSGELAGYHALCFYGYDTDTLYLLHSWGDYCGIFGSISKHYFNNTADQSSYLVILDQTETKIAREIYTTTEIIVTDANKNPIPAEIKVDGVVIGKSPQRIATDFLKTYDIEMSMEGYETLKKTIDGSGGTIYFPLQKKQKSWLQIILDLLDWLRSRIGSN